MFLATVRRKDGSGIQIRKKTKKEATETLQTRKRKALNSGSGNKRAGEQKENANIQACVVFPVPEQGHPPPTASRARGPPARALAYGIFLCMSAQGCVLLDFTNG